MCRARTGRGIFVDDALGRHAFGMVIVIVLGGIYGGVFTLTEAAVHVFFTAVMTHRDLKIVDMPRALRARQASRRSAPEKP